MKTTGLLPLKVYSFTLSLSTSHWRTIAIQTISIDSKHKKLPKPYPMNQWHVPYNVQPDHP